MLDRMDIIQCLKSDVSREILLILSKKPKTVSEIIDDLGQRKPKYNQSVYRILENLRENGMINKCYDPKSKIFYFSLKIEKIEIDICKMEIICHEK